MKECVMMCSGFERRHSMLQKSPYVRVRKGSGQTQAVPGGQPKMRTKRTLLVHEGAFWAMTRQCAGEF